MVVDELALRVLGKHRVWGGGVGSWLLGVDACRVYGFEGFRICLRSMVVSI